MVLRRRTLASSVVCEPLENRQLLSAAPALPAQLSQPATVVPLAAVATTWTPKTAAELTSALANAQLGDTIVLQAGTTYTGQFTLPNKTTGTGWLTITTSNLAQLPGEGVRVKPSDALNMARIQSPGSNASAIRTAAGAHHIKFVGIEFVGPANDTDLVTLIELGTSEASQNTMASVPHDLVIDRCYLHPNTRNAQIRRAIALNSAYTDITNSYIDDIHQEGSDSQAIGGWNGPGPYNILNNYLEAASENIMFGGATAVLPGVVPSDIVIRGNYITKDLDWRDGTNGSNKFSVKNLFEIKSAQRVLMEGNILENCWEGGQSGVAVVLKLGNYDTTPWVVDQDITIRNNIIRHANGGVTLQGRDYASNSPDGLVRRLAFSNNVFDDINGKWSNARTGNGTFFLYITHGPKDVTFDHNTIFNGYTMIEVDANAATYPISNFVWKNNIAAHNAYGVRSTNGSDDTVFTAYFNDAGHLFTKNIVMGGSASKYTTQPGNYFPATWADVKFVNQAAGDYHLAADSLYKSVGTDGKDLGADIDVLTAATASAISGVPIAPPPPPPPSQGKTVYLSDLTWVSATNGSGPVEKDKSVNGAAAGDGRTITLNGTKYTKGLGTQANSTIIYSLSGQYARFFSDIGLDDEIGNNGSVYFQVWLDGAKVYDSGKMTGSTATKHLDIDLTGKSQLKLVVTDAGDGIKRDHADWAGAKIVGLPPASSGTITYLSNLAWASATNGWGPVEKDMSNGETAAGDGHTLTIGGVTYAKGLGTNAASTIQYDLAGRYATFSAVLGVDDEIITKGSVSYQIVADGVVLYTSPVLRYTDVGLPVSVNVSGKSQLTLIVTDGGDGTAKDHADWADAKLIS